MQPFNTRCYPIGIQTFSRIIREGYVYVDKTDLVWRLAHYAPYVFLSRPRRFGKSLLTSTLESYFKGEKELFSELKINDYEQEWKQYPVFRIDVSLAKAQENAHALKNRLMLLLDEYTKIYGTNEKETTPGGTFEGLIRRAYEQTGKQVVIIIDEYDSPLLEVLHKDMLDDMRHIMQEFYTPLKACEAMVKFCFITGITKFSQLSIFSTINNLANVTLVPDFANICGITEDELSTTMKPDIEILAKEYECSFDEMQDKLRLKYDGYHFTRKKEGVYNPFSLLNAFRQKELKNFWFETDTPSYLIHQLQHFKTDITTMDKLVVDSTAFDQPTENIKDALPLLYQSGYLTIKDYDRETEEYTLSLPNQEVRVGYIRGLLPIYIGIGSSDIQVGFAARFWKSLKTHNIDLAMKYMQSFLAGVPYMEGFKQKLAEVANVEGFYEYTMYLIFSMLNVYVRTQVKCAGGRTDIVVWMPDATYVFELKLNGTAEEALEQINSKNYVLPYFEEGKKIVKVGVAFDKETLTPINWKVEE